MDELRRVGDAAEDGARALQSAGSALVRRAKRWAGREEDGLWQTYTATAPRRAWRPGHGRRFGSAVGSPESLALGAAALALIAASILRRSRSRGAGGRRGSVRGSWVKDRSLGGRMVFVPASDGAASASPLADAPLAPSAEPRTPPSDRPRVPAWWTAAEDTGWRTSRPASAAPHPMQRQAQRMLSAVADAKTLRGRDVQMADLVAVAALARTAAQRRGAGAGEAASLRVGSPGQRDALFRAAAQGCLSLCAAMGSAATLPPTGLGHDLSAFSDGRGDALGDEAGSVPDLGALGGEVGAFLTCLAGAVGVAPERAGTMVAGETAAWLRSRLLAALAGRRAGDEAAMAAALLEAGNVLRGMPFAEGAMAPEVEALSASLRRQMREDDRTALAEAAARLVGLAADDAAYAVLATALGLRA